MTRTSDDNLEYLGLHHDVTVLVQPSVLLFVYAYYLYLTAVHATFSDFS